MMNSRNIKNGSSSKRLLYEDEEILDKVKAKPGELAVKVFAPRNSLLTDLCEITHFQVIYNVFLAIMLGLFLNTAAHNYLQKGKIELGFGLIIKGFSNIHIVLLVWCGLFLLSCLIYIGFKYWAIIRTHLKPKSINIKLWDRCSLIAFACTYPFLLYVTIKAIVELNFAIAEAFGLLIEAIRFLMKNHAFIRSNAPRSLKYKPHTDDDVLCPTFSQFVYFSFAPTMIYRDSYPRSSHIRWKFVAQNFFEFGLTLLFISYTMSWFYVAQLEEYGIKHFTWQDIVVTMVGNAGAGMLIKLCVFYIVLHTWQNAFAEMLRFSDRLFYKDWWTSTTQERYFRTWNVVVHDWLYNYIYKDFYEIVIPKNKLGAKLVVFFLSAVFHDIILAFSFGFCVPILFLQFFGAGLAFTFIKIPNNLIGNVLLWYSIALGMGMNTTFYAMEHYARVNCPIEDKTIISYFIPRLFSCGK